MLALVAAAAIVQPAAAAGAPSEQRLSHGRFHDFALYSPAPVPKTVVLLLSDVQGWNRSASTIARHLAQHGALVVGVDLPKLYADLEKDGGQCVYPDGDLENLSHFVQAYAHLPTYLTPLLLGLGSGGGAFAYALLAQAPRDTFGGALSLGFCPQLSLRKPLCNKGSALEFRSTGIGGARAGGLDLVPATAPVGPWIVVERPSGEACRADVARRFVAAVPGAAIVLLPKAPATRGVRPAWLPEYAAAFDNLIASGPKRLIPLPPPDLGDLPVIEIAAQSGGPGVDSFALMMSGDGGWAGLDQGVAAALAAHGIAVVGLDSLRYYWTARTPDGLGGDMDRIIRYYLAHLHKQHVLLIGYSQGADTLPFALNRLPAATRARVSLAALLGVSEHALFEFHLSSWVTDDNSGPATLPEINRIAGVPVLCIYGEDEADSPCPKLDSKNVTVVKLAGGHHFDGDYPALAQKILALGARSP